MKTITVFQKHILDLVVSKKPIPYAGFVASEAAANRLIELGLIKDSGDKFIPIKGASYNYAGNTYTIQLSNNQKLLK
jgi:hypothetical protein